MSLFITAILDNLTKQSLQSEIDLHDIGKCNFRLKKKIKDSSFLLVESAWQGYKDSWKYQIASYPGHPERNNNRLLAILNIAKDCGVPTIFWNKEDSVHFDRFINSAKHFDYIFTVDKNCVEKYRSIVSKKTVVDTMMFAVQPQIHFFDGFNFTVSSANFVGSYSRHIHNERRNRQDILFEAACQTLGLTVFDRNSKRSSQDYRYPKLSNIRIKKAIPYKKTADIYRKYLVSLNVNTITDSPTMFSRRLAEIIACGGIAITTPAKSVDLMFKDYCHIVDSSEEALELLARFKSGPANSDLERARAGAEYVSKNHTWSARINQIAEVLQDR